MTNVRFVDVLERGPDRPGATGIASPAPGLTLSMELSRAQLDAIAQRVAELLVRPPRPELELLTVPEAAGLLRCKPQRIRDLLAQRRLPRVKDGGRTLIARRDLEAYLGDER